ncbi:MAG TPA: efflux RND transporter periplasmic adaptor subunit, partial [Caulobacterales bacterium]|nr:efflux RND transporter periplasmic adaptor subunit [Caulobacterales bacterium]
MTYLFSPLGRSATSVRAWRHVVTATAIVAAVTLSACGKTAAQGDPPPPEVGVVEISPQTYEPTVSLPGRVSAYEVSEVRPQIGGIVLRRAFREGAQVTAGQLLYEIDPSEARASVSSAEAAAASAQARFQRYQHLIDIHAISQQEFDDARAAADQANAALQSARINLRYTRITAPISGVIGAS